MRRTIAGACAVVLAAAGCVSRTHPRIAVAGDLTMLAGALVTIVPAIACTNTGNADEGPGCLALLVTAPVGLAVFGIGAVMNTVVKIEDWRTPAPREVVPPPPPPPPPVALGDLPTLATDAQTLQLAKQARMAAAQHQCTAARLDLAAIGDRAYHDALAASALFDACR